MSGTRVGVGRVYEPGASGETRVLVDRLWPRGVAKAGAPFDEWCKVVAPSTELRRWYGHRPERFEEFKRRYEVELADDGRAQAVDQLRKLARQGRVVLVTAARDVDISAAAVLAEVVGA